MDISKGGIKFSTEQLFGAIVGLSGEAAAAPSSMEPRCHTLTLATTGGEKSTGQSVNHTRAAQLPRLVKRT